MSRFFGRPRRIPANCAKPCSDERQRAQSLGTRTPHGAHWRFCGHVMIRTMLRREEPPTFDAGTLAGAGTFRCEECGFAVALHERDEIPECPHCQGTEFKRASIFGELNVTQEPTGPEELAEPSWLAEARQALDRDGFY